MKIGDSRGEPRSNPSPNHPKRIVVNGLFEAMTRWDDRRSTGGLSR
jgi:hypothetical protein